jgi:hypothetical protein
MPIVKLNSGWMLEMEVYDFWPFDMVDRQCLWVERHRWEDDERKQFYEEREKRDGQVLNARLAKWF